MTESRVRIMTKPKICFICKNLHLLYKNDLPGFGGLQVQLYRLIPYLKEGFEISIIDEGFFQENTEEIRGIKFMQSSGNKRYPSFLRGIVRWVGFLRALNKADADIYYIRGIAVAKFLPFLIIFCKLKKRKFVIGISHDNQVKRLKGSILDNVLNYGIKKSDLIIVQTQAQKKLLKRNYNRDSVVIKSGIGIGENDQEKENPEFILWLSVFRKFKRPEIFLKLAEAIPEHKFIMVGGAPPVTSKIFNEILEKSMDIPNLQCTGFVPYHKVDLYYKKAYLYINTSKAEGFPNAFLEAWVNRVPVVSLNVDPDEIICENGLGFHSGTFEQMVKDVRSLMENENLRREMGNKAKLYVERNHDIKKVAEEYAKVFNTLLAKGDRKK